MKKAALVYRKVSVESASPVRILDELYARLLLDLDQAKQAIAHQSYAEKGAAISHGLRIVEELVAALDVQKAPELSGNLMRLYDYVSAQMTHANLHLDSAALDDAAKVVGILRQAFAEAATKAGG